VQPKMQTWHTDKYFGKTKEIQTQAGQSFARWHAASESVNLLVMAGLVFYLWRVSLPPEGPRYGGIPKLRD
jgi:hypothetical protein